MTPAETLRELVARYRAVADQRTPVGAVRWDLLNQVEAASDYGLLDRLRAILPPNLDVIMRRECGAWPTPCDNQDWHEWIRQIAVLAGRIPGGPKLKPEAQR